MLAATVTWPAPPIKPQRLSHAASIQLADAVKQADPEAIQTLLVQYRRFVYKLIQRHAHGLPEDDAVSVCQYAMVHAARTWDNEGKSNLTTWIGVQIRGALTKLHRQRYLVSGVGVMINRSRAIQTAVTDALDAVTQPGTNGDAVNCLQETLGGRNVNHRMAQLLGATLPPLSTIHPDEREELPVFIDPWTPEDALDAIQRAVQITKLLTVLSKYSDLTQEELEAFDMARTTTDRLTLDASRARQRAIVKLRRVAVNNPTFRTTIAALLHN